MRNPFKKSPPEPVERTADQILTDQVCAHNTRVLNVAMNEAMKEAQERTQAELIEYWRTRGVNLNFA